MLTEASVRRILNTIIDPCSTLAGAPAGIDEFGLVRRVQVVQQPDGTDVAVTLGVTEPGCYMAVYFADQAYALLRAEKEIKSVTIELDLTGDWTPDDMSSTYRARLDGVRATRRRNLQLRVLTVIQSQVGETHICPVSSNV